MIAWAKPKAERRRLINTILQLPINLVACFRAKEKIKPIKNGGVEDRGWMPIAGEEFLYEMTLNALLLPAAGGVPTWDPEQPGERQMVKLPEQFCKMLIEDRRALCEENGEALARWAAGASNGATPRQPEPYRFKSGSHKGQLITEVGDDYLTRLIEAKDHPVPRDVRDAAEAEIERRIQASRVQPEAQGELI